MTRIEQEKKTVRQMVEIYCQGKKHVSKGLCEECSVLLNYAYHRLDHCKFGENKPTCKKCPIHCYKPVMKEKMRQAMRYAPDLNLSQFSKVLTFKNSNILPK